MREPIRQELALVALHGDHVEQQLLALGNHSLLEAAEKRAEKDEMRGIGDVDLVKAWRSRSEHGSDGSKGGPSACGNITASTSSGFASSKTPAARSQNNDEQFGERARDKLRAELKKHSKAADSMESQAVQKDLPPSTVQRDVGAVKDYNLKKLPHLTYMRQYKVSKKT